VFDHLLEVPIILLLDVNEDGIESYFILMSFINQSLLSKGSKPIMPILQFSALYPFQMRLLTELPQFEPRLFAFDVG
jgi:hypothetical protein